jgi:hypothetical protein
MCLRRRGARRPRSCGSRFRARRSPSRARPGRRLTAKRGILIGERAFPTKGEADAYIREVRDKYALGADVTNADDQEFLLDVLDLHPESADKIGPGVDHFEVRDSGSTIGFGIVRSDGSAIDFSWKRCLHEPCHEQQVRGAMRAAVQYHKFAVRDAAFAAGEVRCPITGELLTTQTCHVHHEGDEFVDIADAFANEVGGYERIEVVPADDGIGRRLRDDELSKSWEAYHAEHARMVVVSKHANLSLLRRGRSRR